MCQHQPACPSADAPDRQAAHVVASQPEQGWSLLCNGVVVFEDTGALLPDGRSIPPHPPGPPDGDRPAAPSIPCALAAAAGDSLRRRSGELRMRQILIGTPDKTATVGQLDL